MHGLPGAAVPVGPLAVHFCARAAGVSLDTYTAQARGLAESVLRYYERFQPDAVWVSADTWVSAQAMGATVGSPGPEQPWCGLGPPRVRSRHDLARIPPPDPETQGRYPLMIEALGRVVAALGRQVCVVGCFDQYPFSLAAALMGLDGIMLAVHDDPDLVAALMERGLEYGLAYGRALSDAGAHLLSGGDSPAGLLGPQRYRAVALPFERRLIQALQAATRKPVSLHLCGDTRAILADLASAGPDVLELDHQVDLGAACRTVPTSIALWGNLDPVGLLARGTPAEVERATRDALAVVRASGRARFVLSSGCTLAIDTPFANLDRMFATARRG